MSKKSIVKKNGDKVTEEIADKIADDVKEKATDKIIDSVIDNRKLSDSLEYVEKRANVIAKNTKETLNVISDDYHKRLSEGEEARVIAEKKWVEQIRENQRAAVKGWRDVILSSGKTVLGVVEGVYEYVKNFWYFGEGNKSFFCT